jgi:TolB-like protein
MEPKEIENVSETELNPAVATFYKFGPFRLDAKAGILFRGSEPTALGQRAVSLLQTLVSQPGMPVSKDVLIEAAWPNLTIEESNLTVQIGTLRRELEKDATGQHWIETLSRRGYRYVGPDVTIEGERGPHNNAAVTANQTLELPDKPSIAVLPFDNLGADHEQEYFADGIVEDIVTGLSRIKWLFVIASNSTFTYKGQAVDLKQVGRELGVRYLLQGSVRKTADRVRVTGQLIEAATGAHLWAERFDRKSGDIFVLQDEITLSVVGAIEPKLRQVEVERVKRKRSDSLDAYDLVLQAQADAYSRVPERATKALLLLERALALDPAYALAHAYAAECHHTLFLRGGLREENRTASICHAEAAIANGDDDAAALAFAGFVIGMDKHDRGAAFAAFDAALAISPSSALTYVLGSMIFAWGGQAERAIEWANRGLRLSPLDPNRHTAFIASAVGHYHREQYDEAVDAARRAIQSKPNFSVCYMVLTAPLVKLGQLEEAKAAAARVLELQPAFRCQHQLAGVGCTPTLAASMGEALRISGLPE